MLLLKTETFGITGNTFWVIEMQTYPKLMSAVAFKFRSDYSHGKSYLGFTVLGLGLRLGLSLLLGLGVYFGLGLRLC